MTAPGGSVRLRGLPPVVDAHTHTLLLGSFPGVASLQAAQYYGHPRNHFWPLVGAVFGLPLAEAGYAERLRLLGANGLGLWDVISEAEREGSLDADLRRPLASELAALVAGLPALRTIGFNGATAARLGLKQLGERAARYRILALPSSSPAYTLAFAAKLSAWQALLPP